MNNTATETLARDLVDFALDSGILCMFSDGWADEITAEDFPDVPAKFHGMKIDITPESAIHFSGTVDVAGDRYNVEMTVTDGYRYDDDFTLTPARK